MSVKTAFDMRVNFSSIQSRWICSSGSPRGSQSLPFSTLPSFKVISARQQRCSGNMASISSSFSKERRFIMAITAGSFNASSFAWS